MLGFEHAPRPALESTSERIGEAEDAVARLDERLRASPIREGWISRTHFTDACANLWLEGDLVGLEDLVLHDATRDVRTPSHELTRTHMMLRARRRIFKAAPGWAFTDEGCDVLLDRRGPSDDEQPAKSDAAAQTADTELDAQLAAIDALIARSRRRLANSVSGTDSYPQPSPEQVADRFDAWRHTVAQTTRLTPVAAAAPAAVAWQDLRPIENADWLGRLLVAGLLRVLKKTRVHLCALNTGLKAVARERRQARDPEVRRDAFVHAFALAAEAGLRDHDRWLATMRVFEVKTRGRRSTSHLPELITLVMSKPLVSTGMVATELGVSHHAAQDLIASLGLREMTGRLRYRAWGVL